VTLPGMRWIVRELMVRPVSPVLPEQPERREPME
jgi:hypothetical protein